MNDILCALVKKLMASRVITLNVLKCKASFRRNFKELHKTVCRCDVTLKNKNSRVSPAAPVCCCSAPSLSEEMQQPSAKPGYPGAPLAPFLCPPAPA